MIGRTWTSSCFSLASRHMLVHFHLFAQSALIHNLHWYHGEVTTDGTVTAVHYTTEYYGKVGRRKHKAWLQWKGHVFTCLPFPTANIYQLNEISASILCRAALEFVTRETTFVTLRSGNYRNVFPTYCQHGVRTLQQNHDFYPHQSLHCIIHIKRRMSCDVHVDLHGGVVSNSSVKTRLYAQKVRIKFQCAEWHWRVDMLSTPSCDSHTSSNSHEKLSCFELLSLGRWR